MVKVCSRCVLDSDIPGIRFDENGVCSYCKIQDEWEKRFPLDETGEQKLSQIVNEIKTKGKNKKYDCVMGISGGTDSTYCLYKAKKLGLRPLTVHVDNGWDTDIAMDNVKNLVTKLGVDLKTVICDWDEFKDIQISFLKASVPSAEIPTDIAIKSVLYQVANEMGIHYIISGTSFRTEGKVPIAWGRMDGKYIKSVYKRFTGKKLKTYPNFTIFDRLHYTYIKRIKTISLLDYLDCNKKNAKKIMEEELDWESYGGKHYESIYTRFVQSYLLPEKFNIDKRKVHFSALINSGQMTREEALMKLKNETPYPKDEINKDMEYVLKKLELSEEEFEEMFSQKPKIFLDYPTTYPTVKRLRPLLRLLYRFISSAPPTVFDEMKFFEEDIRIGK
jgi:N-acetyl sugar amidotransferase